MSVSRQDRGYMRRLGEFQAEGHRRAARLWRELDPAARVQKSIEMSLRGRATAHLEHRVDDPAPFYERARALGLYRP